MRHTEWCIGFLRLLDTLSDIPCVARKMYLIQPLENAGKNILNTMFPYTNM